MVYWICLFIAKFKNNNNIQINIFFVSSVSESFTKHFIYIISLKHILTVFIYNMICGDCMAFSYMD